MEQNTRLNLPLVLKCKLNKFRSGIFYSVYISEYVRCLDKIGANFVVQYIDFLNNLKLIVKYSVFVLYEFKEIINPESSKHYENVKKWTITKENTMRIVPVIYYLYILPLYAPHCLITQNKLCCCNINIASFAINIRRSKMSTLFIFKQNCSTVCWS